MSLRLKTYLAFLLLVIATVGSLQAQPVRLNYFPASDSMLSDGNTTALDPGNLLLEQGILVTNQFPNADISFKLSFDRQAWGSYGLGALYSSIFSLQNQAGCYFEVTTTYGQDRIVRKEYYLNRGRCYSIYWNKKEQCWDMKRNRCRR